MKISALLFIPHRKIIHYRHVEVFQNHSRYHLVSISEMKSGWDYADSSCQ